MNRLKIQQGSNVEEVSTDIIKKLYDTALSVSEPIEGEQDQAYLSGHLSVGKSYEQYVKYLAGTVYYRGIGEANNNPNGRFQDLRIDITNDYYIQFEDSAVQQILISGGFSTDGIGVTLTDAANANLGDTFKNNTTITSFPEFKYFTKENTNPSSNLFYGCTNLENVDFSNITKLSSGEFRIIKFAGDLSIPNLQSCSGNSQFEGSKISTVSNLGSITEVPSYMFSGCPNLTTVTIPSTVTTLGQLSFSAYNQSYPKVFTTITGIENVTEYGVSVFINQRNLDLDLTNLNKVTAVGHRVFQDCIKVKGIVNWPNLTTIWGGDGRWFQNTAITKVQSLGKIDYIPAYCFYKDNSSINKDKLTEVYLPYECTSIGNVSFYNCTGLTTLKQYTQSVDNWIEGQTPVYGDLVGITQVYKEGLRNCVSLQSINLPNVTTIEEGAFKGCSSLSSINLSNVITIGQEAFAGCTSLTQITLPITLRTIGARAFMNTHIQKFIIPFGVEQFGDLCRGESGQFVQYIQCPSTLTTLNLVDMYRDAGNSTAACFIVIQSPTVVSSNRTVGNTEGNAQGWGYGRPHLARFYVPDSLVNDYKASDQWSPIATNSIFPISQLETDSPSNWVIYQANKDYGVPQNNP